MSKECAQAQELLTTGLKCLEADPDKELALGIREAIYWSLGPYLFSRGNKSGIGYERRMRLAIAVVHKVLPFWENDFPGDSIVVDVISNMKHIMENKLYKTDMFRGYTAEKWAHFNDRFMETYKISCLVGFCALQAMNQAIDDGFADCDEDEIDLSRLDSQDILSVDLHCLAAAVHAGGPVYPIAAAPNGDLEKREEFWRWWLLEAVPRAWHGSD